MKRPTRPYRPLRARRPGFTLTELLIVIALAVLILALAVPAFSVITGGRSLESAENRVASFIGAARTEAVGLQQPRGVILWEDPATKLVNCTQVYYPPGQTTTPQLLEVYGARDEMVLPQGISLRGIPNSGSNQYNTWPNYCVIMFDGDGRLMQERFGINSGSDLAGRLQNGISPLPSDTHTNIGFLLHDGPAFNEQVGTAAQDAWLKANAVPFLVNRYGGTLMRAE